jgi:hypothetical protein
MLKCSCQRCRQSERPAEKLSVKQTGSGADILKDLQKICLLKPGSGADMLKDLQKSCLLSRLAVVQTC